MNRRFLMILLAGLVMAGPARAAEPRPIVIFAAASLKTALDAVIGARAASGRPSPSLSPRVSYASTAALARQIEAGAPADLFISADVAWMDHIDKAGHLAAGSRGVLFDNRLVLIAGPGFAGSWTLADRSKPGRGLRRMLGDGRLAVARTASVPAGRYARQALVHLGLWDDVADRVTESDNVRTALLLVARGEAPLGIVYATDARADPRVRVLDTFPADSHAPIAYVAARLKSSQGRDGRDERPEAQQLLDDLCAPAAQAIFREYGFATR